VATSSGTGDTLLVAYEFDTQIAKAAWSQNGHPAYNRSLLQINLGELFAIQVNGENNSI